MMAAESRKRTVEPKKKNVFPEGMALITGASSGIGEQFAVQLAAEGISLILAARRKERLEALKQRLAGKYPKISIEIYPINLTIKEETDLLGKWLRGKKIGIVINNAGCGKVGPYQETGEEDAENMDALNILAFHRITRMALEIFEAQGRGCLLNVASSAGLFPAGPYMTQYYASKAYAASLTRGIAEELRQRKSSIYVGCLCPGPVNTEFNEKAGVITPLRGISAETCVWYTIKQMQKKQVLIIPGFGIRAAAACGKFLPPHLLIRITGKQQKKKFSHGGR